MAYKEQETIKFKQINDFIIGIYDMKDKEIGKIFSKGSFGDENTIQICGFDKISRLMGCYNFNGRDVVLEWNMEKANKRTRIEQEELSAFTNENINRCAYCLELKKNCWCKLMKKFYKELRKHEIAMKL